MRAFVDCSSGGPLWLPQVDECSDRSGFPPETLPARDAEDSCYLVCGPLLHVPEEQEVAVAVVEVIHPSADLRPFVERVNQTGAEPLVVLGTRCPYLEDGGGVRLPPIRVGDQAPNDVLGGLELQGNR